MASHSTENRTRSTLLSRWSLPTAACTALLVLTGCASAPVAPPEPAEPIVDPRIAEIGVELADVIDRYTLDLEAFLAGEATTLDLDQHLSRLDALATECSARPDCGEGPILDAYSSLIRRQTATMATARNEHAEELAILTEEMTAIEPEREPGTTSFVGSMPQLERSVSLLQGTDLRDLIVLNGPVRAALDDWLTWLRPALIESYRNYLYLRAEIAPIYEEAGLPEALLFAMIATESRGKVHSTSRAGAAGLLQFMPATGRIYGLRDVDGFDQRFDPASATRANVAYLNHHFALFNNNLEKVMAAYNGGEGRMRGLHRRYGGASLWDERVYYALPRETRDYVPRILAAAWLFLHPEEYGLEFPAVDATTTTLSVEHPIALSELGICLGQTGNPDGWFRTLRNLNPRLDPGERVRAGSALRVPAEVPELYAEHCVDSPRLAHARSLHDANYPPEPETIRYTVRRGDTLNRIAGRFSCADVSTIARMNRISPPRYTIREGQRLKIPACG